MKNADVGGGSRELQEKDYYQILGLSPGSDAQAIRHAYLRLKNTYSGNNQALYSLLSPDDLDLAMDDIEEAFGILSHPEKRASYDNGVPYVPPQLHSVPKRAPAAEVKDILPHRMSDETHETPNFVPASMGTFRKPKAETDENSRQRVKMLFEESRNVDGPLLKEMRDILGIKLDEMQDVTKVSIGYLAAMETENFLALPQTIYVKGFLKSYLRYLGLPFSEDVIKAYIQRQTTAKAAVE